MDILQGSLWISFKGFKGGHFDKEICAFLIMGDNLQGKNFVLGQTLSFNSSPVREEICLYLSSIRKLPG